MTPDLNEPTPERLRRSAFVTAPAIGTEMEPAKAGRRMYRALTAVERLLRDAVIEPRMADAGERLRIDWEVGVIGARDGTGSGGSAGWYYAEVRLRALGNYRRAIATLGPLQRCVQAIALHDMTISELSRLQCQNRQEVAGIVKLGLTTLADHYEIA